VRVDVAVAVDDADDVAESVGGAERELDMDGEFEGVAVAAR
jgi:hypothetical protein